MKHKMSAILNQSESSLGSDHKRGIQRKGVIAKMQRIKLNSMRFQTKRRCLFNALNAESMEERHDKFETKGESSKNIITTAETKIKMCYK